MSMLGKLKQFKDLRDQGKKLQDALSGETATAKTFGDNVVLVMDGNMGIQSITIDPSVLTPDKKVKLENAIKDAHNDALKKMQRIVASKMQAMGGFPGLTK